LPETIKDLNYAIGILIGYLLGSILPAYFMTKFLTGSDIRTLGNGNPGTTNVKREIGLFAAVITASYDTTKGLIAMAISLWIFKFPLFWVYMSGIGAIAGHLFPFYLKFKGGRGVATATGMLLVSLFEISVHMNFHVLIGDIIYLVFFVLCIYFTSSDENFLALTTLPVLSMLVIIRAGFSNVSLFAIILMTYIFVISMMNLKKLRILNLKDENVRLWRIFLRPASMSFVLLDFFMQRSAFLTLIGIVLAIFFFMDLIRLLSERVNISLTKKMGRFKIYKAKEAKRFSSMTLFLMGVFLIFIIFDRNTAVLSLGFLVFGDMAAKIIGISYGRRKIFKPLSKTVEGFLGFAAAAISVSYFSWIFGIHPLWISICGAIIAAIVESLPLSVDDNLSVPLLSGAIMTFFKMI